MLRNHWSGRSLRRAIPKRWRPVGLLTSLVQQRTGSRVLTGPFKGMAYVDEAFSSTLLPKLIGIYERELHGVVEKACTLAPSLVVDIGAAEGYYAVGTAMRLRDAHVVAFEMDRDAQEALRKLAAKNDVAERIDVLGECDPASLAGVLSAANRNPNQRHARQLIICDAEGAERQLLDPLSVPELLTAHLLVELHQQPDDDVADILRKRFSPSHVITELAQEPRTTADFPFRTPLTALLPRTCIEWGVSEWRPNQMSWLWMEPKEV